MSNKITQRYRDWYLSRTVGEFIDALDMAERKSMDIDTYLESIFLEKVAIDSEDYEDFKDEQIQSWSIPYCE